MASKAGSPAPGSLRGGGCSGPALAIRAAPPVRDFRLVDLIAVVVVCREAWRFADRAVNVDHTPTDATDQMVMVVADAILEASR